ncbi:hypothetical protein TGPRC2_300090 [Toxoplasma gondii TgCatPRC2]|uniref:Uncharacterized protein n=1 Tax=Toxoplasma gondii TgCatPRC2 TaxID=1130821 RepID=A0A151H0E1_TOXGO|nr:hypothetical protein TGPRC2_300090 [Toxoplasma gondii TgCatPRC2]
MVGGGHTISSRPHVESLLASEFRGDLKRPELQRRSRRLSVTAVKLFGDCIEMFADNGDPSRPLRPGDSAAGGLPEDHKPAVIPARENKIRAPRKSFKTPGCMGSEFLHKALRSRFITKTQTKKGPNVTDLGGSAKTRPMFRPPVGCSQEVPQIAKPENGRQYHSRLSLISLVWNSGSAAKAPFVASIPRLRAALHRTDRREACAFVQLPLSVQFCEWVSRRARLKCFATQTHTFRSEIISKECRLPLVREPRRLFLSCMSCPARLLAG